MANKTIENLVGALSHVLRQVERNGPLDHEQLEVAADAMVDSVVRCPNAFHWLMKLRSKDAQSHDHSLRSALWAVQFGRHIGLDKNQLQDICLAALLKRVGILHLDTALVRNTVRSAEEEKEYHRFVVLGVAHLQKSGFKNQRVLNIIKYHCERYDGSGYPVGLSGNKIPFLSSVVGIAGEFDALCNPNVGGRTISASKATSHLYETRQKLFAEDLVVEFIRSIGLYPPGTVVELSTGDCAMVVEQDPRARLTPKIAVFDSVSEFTSTTNYVLVDLKHEQLARQKLSGFGRRQGFSVARLSIVKDIDPQKFTVDQSLLPALLSQSFDDVLASSTGKGEQGGFFNSLAKRLGR